MKRRTRKLLSLLMAVVLALSLCPAATAIATHSHPNTDVQYIEFSAEALEGTIAGGCYHFFINNYYEADDADLTVLEGTMVYLCMNGGVLNLSGHKLINNGTLIIQDCAENPENTVWYYTEDGSFCDAAEPGAEETPPEGTVEMSLKTAVICGGSVENNGSLTAENVSFVGNTNALNLKSTEATALSNCGFYLNKEGKESKETVTETVAGAAINNSASTKLTLTNCTFANNGASGKELNSIICGSAVGAEYTFNECTFTGNYYHRMIELGGTGLKATFNKCDISGNTIYGIGKQDIDMSQLTSVQLNGGTADFTECTFVKNLGPAYGYAVQLNDVNATMTNCTFTENGTKPIVGYGSAVYAAGGKLTVDSCTFTDNVERALYLMNGAAEVKNSGFTGNDDAIEANVDEDKTAISFYKGFTPGEFNPETATYPIKINNCTFTGNKDVAVAGSANIEVTKCKFDKNGRGFIGMCGAAKLTDCDFTGNDSKAYCAVYAMYAYINMTDCTVKNFKADTEQQGYSPVIFELAQAELCNVEVTGNVYSWLSKYSGNGVAAVAMFAESSATISGKCVFDGNVVETLDNNGNVISREQSNLLLIDTTLTVDETKGLDKDSRIGVAVYNLDKKSIDPVDSSETLIVTEASKDYSSCFYSDAAIDTATNMPLAITSRAAGENGDKYEVVLKPVECLITVFATTPEGKALKDYDSKSYVNSEEVFNVSLKVEGSDFAGADYTLIYGDNTYELLDAAGNPAITSNEDGTLECSIPGVKAYRVSDYEVMLSVDSVIAGYGDWKEGLTAEKLLPEDTVIATYSFKAKSVDMVKGNYFTVNGKTAPTWRAAGEPANAVTISSTVQVNVLPPYSLELVSDYVSGQALVLLYTDFEMKMTCDGCPMVGLNDKNCLVNGSPAYYTYNSANGKSYGTNNSTYVYACLIENIENNESPRLTIDSVAELVRFAGTGSTATIEISKDPSNPASPYDVNSSDIVDLYDAVAAMATYNVNSNYFSRVEGVCEYLNAILRADVNRDKKVDTADVALVLANYGDVSGN